MRYAAALLLLLPTLAFADATFTPLDPAPQPLTLAPTTIVAGSALGISYSANYATACTTQQAGCATVTVVNADCAGIGPQQRCNATGTLSVPADTKACTATLTTTCQPGSVISQAQVKITEGGGPTPPPPEDCKDLAQLPTGTGTSWARVVKSNAVKFGDNTVATNRDPTDYESQWTYPGNPPNWPGNSGTTTRPTGAAKNMYFAEKFVVSTTSGGQSWSWTGSGIDSNASLTISACAGDFGQTGTQLTTGCRVDISKSSNGLRTIVAATQQGIACTLKPGATYYLNLLPVASLPAVLTGGSVSKCTTGLCAPWIVKN